MQSHTKDGTVDDHPVATLKTTCCWKSLSDKGNGTTTAQVV